MQESAMTQIYAKSLYQLGREQNVQIADELTRLNEVISANNNLEIVLFFEAFTTDEKISVIQPIMDKLNLSLLTKNSVYFLILEGRIQDFPLIFRDLIVLDDHEKGFLRGSIEGCEDKIPENFEKAIYQYFKNKFQGKIQLEYKKNDKITAGYRIVVNDLQLDASLDHQFNQLRTDILNF